MSKNLDPKQLEIKTLSVENTLTPLVMQVMVTFDFLYFYFSMKEYCS